MCVSLVVAENSTPFFDPKLHQSNISRIPQQHLTEGATCIWRVAITLGIGPHSSKFCLFLHSLNINSVSIPFVMLGLYVCYLFA